VMDRLTDTHTYKRTVAERENNFRRDGKRGQRAVNGEKKREKGEGEREGLKERTE